MMASTTIAVLFFLGFFAGIDYHWASASMSFQKGYMPEVDMERFLLDVCPCQLDKARGNLLQCQEVGPCPVGETLDECGCCPVCYKDVGEVCGGPLNAQGTCAPGMICVGAVRAGADFNGRGVCITEREERRLRGEN
ncbi:unnamed protein product [Cyprideis torosa]|uniref:Uncharacterized protein n=1 Tax=Cyprideis torosa TaxID=163714 RepID=A0A7R8W786_9CRUS|nr:unnamed protein product [Cyprideis torosa]CAG0887324.1 unnamed protein product [Cyprideis torosa]